MSPARLLRACHIRSQLLRVSTKRVTQPVYANGDKMNTSHKAHRPFEDVQAERPDLDGSRVFEYSKTPDPSWKPGQGLNNLASSADFRAETPFRSLDPDTTAEKGLIYKMMISAIAPRPIAFCSTVSPEGVYNLAPFSYFQMMNFDPPTVVIGVQTSPSSGGREAGPKDTGRNITETGEFCVSIISEPLLEGANYTSIDAPVDVDEWKLAGFTQRDSRSVKPPHVAESAFSMECKLDYRHASVNDNGKETGAIYIGRIKQFHIKEFVLDPEDPGLRIMPEKFRVISRLGGITYGRTIDGFELPRYSWEKVKDDPDVQEALKKDVKRLS